MTTSPTKRLLCCFRLTTLHTHKKKTSKKKESQLSRRHLALSANPTVHRMDCGGLYCHWSAIPQLGRCGSKPTVKGRTAVGSAGRRKAHLPTCIIENPPTVIAQTLLPLSLSSVSSVSSTAHPDRHSPVCGLNLLWLCLHPKAAHPLCLCKFINLCSIALSSDSCKMLESAFRKSPELSTTSPLLILK